VALFTSFVVRREISTGYWGLGCLMSTVINRVIKKIVEQPRPPGSANTGYGMPSAHSNMMAFLAMYFALWLCLQVKLDRPSFKLPGYALAAGFAVLVPVSRVVLGVHTISQVVVGGVLGGALAICWFKIGTLLARPQGVFRWLEQTRVARALYLKDSSAIDNVLKAEYLLSRKLRGL
jgi:dolichyldiphosphatase